MVRRSAATAGSRSRSYRAFDGTGIVSFLAALADARARRAAVRRWPAPVAIDRGLAFGLLAIAALAGVALWLPNVLDAPEGLLPDRAYGWWIAAVGAIVHGPRRVRDLAGAASPLTVGPRSRAGSGDGHGAGRRPLDAVQQAPARGSGRSRRSPSASSIT